MPIFIKYLNIFIQICLKISIFKMYFLLFLSIDVTRTTVLASADQVSEEDVVTSAKPTTGETLMSNVIRVIVI